MLLKINTLFNAIINAHEKINCSALFLSGLVLLWVDRCYRYELKEKEELIWNNINTEQNHRFQNEPALNRNLGKVNSAA